MQFITHAFSGIFMMALIQALVPVAWLRYVLMLPSGILLHFLVDGLVDITYHPPNPRLQDPFWKGWHAVVIAGSILVAIVFWVPYFWGVFFACTVDIVDWGITRPVCVLKKVQLPEDPNLYPRYFIHHWIGRFRSRCFSFLPDWKEKRRGILPEIAIWVVSTLVVVFFL
ncbi:MAG: hypothetical protein Q6373_008930 [Candidatus Sigynarchaeota archaeon]